MSRTGAAGACSPGLTGPCRGGVWDCRHLGRRGACSHPSLQTTLVEWELSLHIVYIQPWASHGYPSPTQSNFIFVSRSTSLQSATTCARLATALGVPSAPLRTWKVSAGHPAGSACAAVVDTPGQGTRRRFLLIRVSSEGGGQGEHPGTCFRVLRVGSVAGQALWGPEGPFLQVLWGPEQWLGPGMSCSFLGAGGGGGHGLGAQLGP